MKITSLEISFIAFTIHAPIIALVAVMLTSCGSAEAGDSAQANVTTLEDSSEVQVATESVKDGWDTLTLDTVINNCVLSVQNEGNSFRGSIALCECMHTENIIRLHDYVTFVENELQITEEFIETEEWEVCLERARQARYVGLE